MSNVDHTKRDDGVDVFIFHKNDRNAIDEWIPYIRELYHSTPDGEKINILMDIRASGALPVQYLFRSLKDLSDANPGRPSVRLAALMQDSILRTVVDSLMRIIMRNDELRYFDTDEEATEWLHSGMPDVSTNGNQPE